MYNEELENYFKEKFSPFIQRPSTREKDFSNIDEMIDYLNEERSYWNGTGYYWIKNSGFYTQVQNSINAFRRNSASNLDQAKRDLDNIIVFTRTGQKGIIDSHSDIGMKLKELYEKSKQQANGFYAMHIKENRQNIDPEYLSGALTYYLYENKFDSLDEKYSNTYDAINNMEEEYSTKFNKLHSKTEEKLRDHDKNIENQQNSFNTWQEKFIANTDNEREIEKKEFERLHNLYEEFMRLSGPCKYWRDLDKSYEKRGTFWIKCAILPAVLIVLSVICLLYFLPEKIINNDNISIERIVRFSILLALWFTPLFYFLRLIIKLALSSFHLSRDARERNQLTHIYLALMDKKSFDEKQRSIILQSLFSRADTGLLKGDSSPAIPDSLLSTIARSLKA